MKHHVVLDGPDGAGKTTLAKIICKQYGMWYRHEGPPPPGVPVFQHYSGLLEQTTEPTVFDRLHVGELVYGPLLRGASGLTREQVDELNEQVTLVICLPPWNVCLANTRGRVELIKDVTVLYAAYIRWVVLSVDLEQRALIERRSREIQVYDYTASDFHLEVK